MRLAPGRRPGSTQEATGMRLAPKGYPAGTKGHSGGRRSLLQAHFSPQTGSLKLMNLARPPKLASGVCLFCTNHFTGILSLVRSAIFAAGACFRKGTQNRDNPQNNMASKQQTGDNTLSSKTRSRLRTVNSQRSKQDMKEQRTTDWLKGQNNNQP